MKYIEVINLVHNSLQGFLEKDNGFEKIPASGGIGYQRIGAEKKVEFGCNLRSYIDLFICDHFNAAIYFLVIEKIVTPIFVRHGIIGKSVLESYQPTIGIGFHRKVSSSIANQEPRQILPLEIRNEADTLRLAALMKTFFEQEVVPFFEEWCDIRNLLPFIERKTSREISQIFISGAIFKKAVIWKLCSHPSYEDYMKEIMENIERGRKANPREIQYERFSNIAHELKEVLAGTAPLYEWDEAYLKE